MNNKRITLITVLVILIRANGAISAEEDIEANGKKSNLADLFKKSISSTQENKSLVMPNLYAEEKIEKENLAKAIDYMKDGKNNEAIEIANQILKSNSNKNLKFNALILRASSYSALKKYEMAIKDLEFLNFDPFTTSSNYASLYYIRGDAYAGINNSDKAIQDYRRASKLDPSLIKGCNSGIAGIYSDLGASDLKKNNYDDAITHFTKAIEIIPNNEYLYCSRGYSYEQKKDFKNAINDYSRAIELQPSDASKYFNRADVYEAIGEFDSAISDYTKSISLDPDNLMHANFLTYYSLADIYSRKGSLDQAISNYSKAIEINGSSAEIYFFRGDLYQKSGNLEKSILDYSKAIQISPNDADFYFARGKAYSDRGDHDQAISDYTKVIEINPGNSKAYFNRALNYSLKEQYSRGLQDLSQARRLGGIDLNFIKRLEEKITNIQELVREHRDSQSAIVVQAITNSMQEYSREARQKELIRYQTEQQAYYNNLYSSNLSISPIKKRYRVEYDYDGSGATIRET